MVSRVATEWKQGELLRKAREKEASKAVEPHIDFQALPLLPAPYDVQPARKTKELHQTLQRLRTMPSPGFVSEFPTALDGPLFPPVDQVQNADPQDLLRRIKDLATWKPEGMYDDTPQLKCLIPVDEVRDPLSKLATEVDPALLLEQCHRLLVEATQQGLSGGHEPSPESEVGEGSVLESDGEGDGEREQSVVNDNDNITDDLEENDEEDLDIDCA
ncbi:hypothetical protein IAT40_006049 [Kwoniella sp. CBS 6097]